MSKKISEEYIRNIRQKAREPVQSKDSSATEYTPKRKLELLRVIKNGNFKTFVYKDLDEPTKGRKFWRWLTGR